MLLPAFSGCHWEKIKSKRSEGKKWNGLSSSSSVLHSERDTFFPAAVFGETNSRFLPLSLIEMLKDLPRRREFFFDDSSGNLRGRHLQFARKLFPVPSGISFSFPLSLVGKSKCRKQILCWNAVRKINLCNSKICFSKDRIERSNVQCKNI